MPDAVELCLGCFICSCIKKITTFASHLLEYILHLLLKTFYALHNLNVFADVLLHNLHHIPAAASQGLCTEQGATTQETDSSLRADTSAQLHSPSPSPFLSIDMLYA